MIGATPTLGGQMTTETETAFAELLDEVQVPRTPAWSEQLADDETTLLEAHKWVLSILQVAAEVNSGPTRLGLASSRSSARTRSGAATTPTPSTATPRSTPTRTYRVRLEPGDAVYLSLTVYGGPDDGRYSTRIVGSVNSEGRRARRRRSASTSSSRRTDRRARRRLDPAGARRRGRHHTGLPRRPATRDGGRPGTSRRTTHPRPIRQDDADLARRFRATTTWVREQASIVPIPLGTPNAVDPPYPVPTTTFGWAAGDAAYAMGAFELADDEALVIRGRSPECVFWNMCLWNPLLHTYNYDYERVTINGAAGRATSRTAPGPSSSSARRPAHPNWVVDGRAPHGPHLVPLVPARPPLPSSPRSRSSRSAAV